MMLRIYPVSLELVRLVAPYVERIRRHHPELALQLEDATTRIPLNLAEGMYSRGRNRTARYHFAMGTAREAFGCLEVAEVRGFIGSIDHVLRDKFDHVIGTLVKIVKPGH